MSLAERLLESRPTEPSLCRAGSVIAATEGDDRALVDLWLAAHESGSAVMEVDGHVVDRPPIVSMAVLLSEETGMRVGRSALSAHLRGTCCCDVAA